MLPVAWFLCAQIATQPAVPAPSVPSHAENLVACSTWIPTFGPRGTLARPAYALAVHDFGAGPQLVVGGELGATGPTTLRGVALWTGSEFAPFAGGFNSNSLVRAFVTDPDPTVGGLIAVGSSIPGGGVARWNGSAFVALGSGLALANPSYPGETPFGIASAVHDAGAGAELYVVGRFDRAGGQVCTGFAKWNGTAWSVPATPPISGIRALVQYDDGSGRALFAAGSGMARLSAGSWVVTPGETGPFTDLAVLDVGSGPQLFGLGQFAGGGWPDVARWNGSGWTRLDAPPGTPLALGVHDFGSGPRLVISSSLSGASGELHAYDGATWQTLPGTFTTASPPNGVALALRSFDDGSGPRLFAAGSFTAVGGVGAGHFASFDGTTWYGGVTGLDGSVNAFLAHDDGSGRALYVGGGFASIDARTDLRGIARWDGTGWSAVGGGIANGGVLALAAPDLGSGRQLIAGGAFTASAGNAGASIQRWTGSSWQPLGSGVQMDSGATATVSALCEYDDGSGNALYVAGRFDRAGGVVRRGIARWNGTSWSTVGAGGVAGDFPRVNALAVFDDGGGPKLYAAGIFSSMGDEPAAGIAKWNGGHWSAVSPGVMSASDVIFTLATHDDGNGTQLYVGGVFDQVAGFPARSIARWNGSTWSTLGGGGFVNSVRVLRSGHTDSGPALFVGGFAVQPGGPTGPSMLSSWNGAWSNLALTGQNGGSVYAVAEYDDGTTRALYAGGQFTVSPSGDSNLMRRGCPSDTAFQVFCAGDGSATACPCANSGATGRGCANSVVGAGALLGHSGTASVGNADLVLAGSGMPNAACLYVQGTTQQNGGAGVVFGDGLRCAGGTLTRLGVRINSSNGSSLPGPGEPSIAQRGGIPAVGGVTRYYQIWYRNSASFCAPTSFNLSNGLSVDWGA